MLLTLAEISDKMGTISEHALLGAAVALVAAALGRFRRWLVLLPLPLIAAYDLSFWAELHEPGFGHRIISELGWSWVIGCSAGWNFPYLAALVYISLRPRRFCNPGRCTQCDYSLYGLTEPRCPECGTPFSPPAPATRNFRVGA